MRRLVPLLVFATACTAGSDPTTTTTTTAGTETSAAGGTVDIEIIPPSSGPTEVAPAPDIPDGEVDESVQKALEDVLVGVQTGAFESESLEPVVAAADPRVAWFLADLLRFVQTGQESLAISSAFTRITGAALDNDGHPLFVPAFDNLFAWDLPAWSGYEALKRRLYTAVEPGWDAFFIENVSLDWRYVTWGGVLIDARPFPATEPCPGGCIPALDNPATTDAEGGDWYPDDAVVFGVVVGDEAIAFPKNQMQVHEMVNLTLGGRRLGIPYCTLCGSAQAYLTDSVPSGFDTAVLRTSGLLSRSNKVMYDLESGSVLDTFTGEARTGPLAEAGVVLEQVSVVASRWGDWKQAHPNTRIVAEDGGIGRLYAPDPLGGRDDDGPIFPVGPVDPRLSVHDPVIGVVYEGTAYSFAVAELESALPLGPVGVDGLEVIADGSGFRVEGPDGELPTHESFWFAWSQFHPETLLVRVTVPG